MAVNKSRRQRKVARDKRNRQSGGFNLNAMASPKFIESALSEVLDEIVHIEVQHNTYLAGDRADFDRARVDWRLLTRGQVQHAVSLWRDGIVKRYS